MKLSHIAAIALALVASSLPRPAPAFTFIGELYQDATFYNTYQWTQTGQFSPNYPTDSTAFIEALNERYDSAGSLSSPIIEGISYCQGSCFGTDTNVFFGFYFNGGTFNTVLLVNNPRTDNISNSLSISSSSQMNLYVDNTFVGDVSANSMTGFRMDERFVSSNSQSTSIVENFTSGFGLLGLQYYAGGSSYTGWPTTITSGNSVEYDEANMNVFGNYTGGTTQNMAWTHS
jgi:hypothetical protein